MSQDNSKKHRARLIQQQKQLKSTTKSLGDDFEAWLSWQKESRKHGGRGFTDVEGPESNHTLGGEEAKDAKMTPAEFQSRRRLELTDATSREYAGLDEKLLESIQKSSLLGQNRRGNHIPPREPRLENAAARQLENNEITEVERTGIMERLNFVSFPRNISHDPNFLQYQLLLQHHQKSNQPFHLPTSLSVLDNLRSRGGLVLEDAIGSALMPTFANALLPPTTSLDPLQYPAREVSVASRLSLSRFAVLEQLLSSSQEHQTFASAAAAASIDSSLTPINFAAVFGGDGSQHLPTPVREKIFIPRAASSGERARSTGERPRSSVIPANASDEDFAVNGVDDAEGRIRLAAPGETKKRRIKKDKYKPKRPLSAYNLFFQEERSKLLSEIANSTGNTEDSCDIGTLARGQHGAPIALKRKRRRDRGEPHGMIAFEKLAKIIGARWKNVTGERLAAYQLRAETDLQRYKQEMEAYRQMDLKRARYNDPKENTQTSLARL